MKAESKQRSSLLQRKMTARRENLGESMNMAKSRRREARQKEREEGGKRKSTLGRKGKGHTCRRVFCLPT